jgi:hypothetical protein
MTPIEMLEEMNLRREYSVVARSWLDEDEGEIVRSDAVFEDMAGAEELRKLLEQFKKPDGKPSYTEVKIAVRYCTDWSCEVESNG